MRLIFIFLFSLLAFSGCSESDPIRKIAGEAQGTTWHITYISDDPTNHKPAIDSILRDLDMSLSTWVDTSLISRINRNEINVSVDRYFSDVFLKSVEVSNKTNGLFDVTIGPLVNAWGFGPGRKAIIDSLVIDSLLSFVNYKMLRLESGKIIKAKPQIFIDFNAIAQGYSVDVLAEYLEKNGIKNYLVELGGELIAKGRKNRESWTAGIDQPSEQQGSKRQLRAIVELNNRALATSGNYRKFYEEDGKKYAHIIDPRTGYPAKQNILSASVMANDAMSADAYATSFMIMGLDASRKFLKNNNDLNLDVFFVYDDRGRLKSYYSDGLKDHIKEID